MMFTYKELIEVAIGSPESGHVNFYALQVLLTCFAQRLDIIDQFVEQDDYMKTNVRFQNSLMSLARRSRMYAGADAEEGAPAEPEVEAPAEAEAPPAEAEEVPPPDQAEEAPPLAQDEEAAAEEIAEPEPTEAAPEPEPTPGQEEAPAPQPEPEPSQGSHEPELEVPAEEKSLEIQPSRVSRSSTRDKQIDAQLANTVVRLENRLARMELAKEKSEMDTKQFVTSITGQVKVTMKQLDTVAHMLMDQKPNRDRIKVLRHTAKELRVLMGTVDEEVSIKSSRSDGHEGEEEHDELQEVLSEESSAPTPMETVEDDEKMGLSVQLFYSPSRMLSELLDFKLQFCALNNKFIDLSAAFLKQDTQKLFGMITDLQVSVRELKLFQSSQQESGSNMMTHFKAMQNQVIQLQQAATHLDSVKCDKTEVELLLAEKVDYQQLATKVSLEQLEEFNTKMEIKFCEVRHIISLNEKNLLQIIDNLRMTLGIDALELGLKDFREMIERKVHLVADALQKYMEMTNDDCAAAAGRVKVMQDLACLSCDTNCVMRTVERSKVPTLPAAKGATGLGPIISYELGQIRKSGVMGYYRKDEFPHTTSAWAKGTSGASMVKCIPRHAGGTHTIYTAEDHLQKVVLSKKNTEIKQ